MSLELEMMIERMIYDMECMFLHVVLMNGFVLLVHTPLEPCKPLVAKPFMPKTARD
jgi:hypothetical protein